MGNSLNKLLNELRREEFKNLNLHVPDLWQGKFTSGVVSTNYHDFFVPILETILENKEPETDYLLSKSNRIKGDKGWTKNAVTYNLFVRLFTAFDHNQDGKLGEGKDHHTINNDGIKETGTFLKTIALLPYLKSMGINTIHLLPVTSIGTHNNKGNMGSPYAIKNHYQLDENLADPLISLSIEEQFAALIEAIHILDMRVVLEFILRTSSMDADWIQQHPDWYYWIKDEVKTFSPPEFTNSQLEDIMLIPKGKGKFIPPSEDYKSIFMAAPAPDNIHEEDGKHIGISQNTRVRVPSAFADWPPNDPQPPWTDVTYLKLYKKDPEYNYIAYNTIRYLDPELEKEQCENKALWESLTGLIPSYQKKYGIDGVMIDMGHALPLKLKQIMITNARNIDPAFAFWDENFSILSKSKKAGYDAVIGNAWYLAGAKSRWEELFTELFKKKPLFFFGTPETHNSPRFCPADAREKKLLYFAFQFMPSAITFIHNGFELNEKMPVNTGLNFSKRQMKGVSNETLPLFNKSVLNWTTDTDFLSFIVTLNNFKKLNPELFDKGRCKMTPLATGNEKSIGFRLVAGSTHAILILNFGKTEHRQVIENIGSHSSLRNMLNNTTFAFNPKAEIILEPYGFFIGRLIR